MNKGKKKKNRAKTMDELTKRFEEIKKKVENLPEEDFEEFLKVATKQLDSKESEKQES